MDGALKRVVALDRGGRVVGVISPTDISRTVQNAALRDLALHPENRAGLEATTAQLARLGHELIEVHLPLPSDRFIASYALLTHMVAQVVGLRVAEFVHTFGDLHLYANHLEQAKLQLSQIGRAHV